MTGLLGEHVDETGEQRMRESFNRQWAVVL